MATFRIQFQRYSPTTETRLSNIIHKNADNLREALDKADLIVEGLRNAAPEYDYTVVSILSNDYCGVDCSQGSGGGLLFETAAEFSERVKLKNGEQ